MNNNIARVLHDKFHSSDPETDLKVFGLQVVNAHNQACTYGFLNLPQLQFDGIDVADNHVSLYAYPQSGMASLDDLYNIKSAWGADNLYVSKEGLEIVFDN